MSQGYTVLISLTINTCELSASGVYRSLPGVGMSKGVGMPKGLGMLSGCGSICLRVGMLRGGYTSLFRTWDTLGTTGYGRQVGSTHPTVMLSCSKILYAIKFLLKILARDGAASCEPSYSDLKEEFVIILLLSTW